MTVGSKGNKAGVYHIELVSDNPVYFLLVKQLYVVVAISGTMVECI